MQNSACAGDDLNILHLNSRLKIAQQHIYYYRELSRHYFRIKGIGINMISNSEGKEYAYKILLIGTSGVGKSCILSRILRGTFPNKTSPTIGVEFSTKIFTSHTGHKIRAQIWDTGCLTKYKRVVMAHLKKAHGVLCVIDICDQGSFESIKNSIDEMRRYGDPQMAVMIVGNKFDLCNGTSIIREVGYNEASRYCEINGMLYEDVSALQNYRIDLAMESLINRIYDLREQATNLPQVKVPVSLMDEFHCGICSDYFNDAIETACCHNLACESCFINQANCPWCKCSEMKYTSSYPIRRIVSNLPTNCPDCEMAMKRRELPTHTLSCPKRKISCPFCYTIFIKDTLSSHLFHSHEEAVLNKLLDTDQTRYIVSINDKGVLSNDGFHQENAMNAQEDLIGEKLNRDRNIARLGVNGKYYCGGRNNTCKECCGGVCGPYDGCNCTGCMELDVKTRKLPKGYLVNREGRICRRYENGTVFCGCRGGVGVCSFESGESCKACEKMQRKWDNIYSEVNNL